MHYNTAEQLKSFSRLPIEWNLDPADAVTLYLEWGNHDWHAEHHPIRSKDDFSHYFVLDNWTDNPTLRLVMRNSEATEDSNNRHKYGRPWYRHYSGRQCRVYGKK